MAAQTSKGTRKREWPTIALAVSIYVSWIALTYFNHQLPTAAVILLGASLIALHSSFQHEVVHGHPTDSKVFNYSLGSVPLSLWLPFEIYRRDHLRHHVNDFLTLPSVDPESKYFTKDQWLALTWFGRAFVRLGSSLLGWVILGPLWTIGGFLLSEARRLFKLDRERIKIWFYHIIAVLPVVLWLLHVCHLSPIEYVLYFVYPGTSILMLRSFAEHKAADLVEHRSAVIESNSLLSFLFLNNNLHAVHHKHPSIPWYRLPDVYWKNRSRFLEENGWFVYDGYSAVVRKYLIKAHDQLLHPLLNGDGITAVDHIREL